VLRELGLAEFNANQPGWEDHLTAAVEAAGDDAIRAAAALFLATTLGFRIAEAVAQLCTFAHEPQAQAREPKYRFKQGSLGSTAQLREAMGSSVRLFRVSEMISNPNSTTSRSSRYL
jgi:hypothetical protein